ncbi:hypothetical protein C8Q79DRAFT_411457 [Trametes meyenii]|nr:hypothetical protein C8Q79DRAFT_411457 [Trametes meyenii]
MTKFYPPVSVCEGALWAVSGRITIGRHAGSAVIMPSSHICGKYIDMGLSGRRWYPISVSALHPPDLSYYLAVPVLTFAMDQAFSLHNIDREENYCRRTTEPNCGEEVRAMDLADLLFKQDHGRLIDNLRLPCLTGLREAEQWLGSLEDLTPLYGCKLVATLPVELLFMIFDLLSWEEAICLALTSRQFFEQLKPRLLKILRCIHPSWAGCRLICLGESAEGIDDLPAGLLSALERQEFLDGRRAAMISLPGESPPVDLRLYALGGVPRAPRHRRGARAVPPPPQGRLSSSTCPSGSSSGRTPRSRRLSLSGSACHWPQRACHWPQRASRSRAR